MKTKLLKLLVCISAMSLFGCGQGSSVSSSQATQEHPFVLNVAHSLNETHATHQAFEDMAEIVKERTNGRLILRIFPNAQLGADSATLEQTIAGVVAMTNVGSPALGTYNDAFHTFGLPYLFHSKEEYYKVMDSAPMHEFFMHATRDKGFIVLTYFTSGQRSFYTKDKPIRSPADLRGLKFRVQDMKSQTDMLKTLGGTPIVMAYGEVFTSLQAGIIDGTENNELALTQAKHGEICKVFSVDQHAMIPDVVVMSLKIWNALTPEDQKILVEAAKEATERHKVAWDIATESSINEAKTQMGVTFITDIDKEPFIKATEPLRLDYAEQYSGVKMMLELIEKAKEN